MTSIARNKRRQLCWIPGHKGIEGHGIGNEIVKNHRLSSRNVSDIGKPMHCVYDGFDRSMERNVKLRWNYLPDFKTARVTCKAVNQKHTKVLQAVDKSVCRNMD